MQNIDFQVLMKAGLQFSGKFGHSLWAFEETSMPFPCLPFLPRIFSFPGHTFELNHSNHFESGEAKYLSELQIDLTGQTEWVLLLAAALDWRNQEC